MILRSLFFLVFCLACFSVQAQTIPSTLVEEEEEVDTVYFEDEPVVVEEKLVIHTEKTVKLYLSGYLSLFKNYNYYIPCEGWDARLNTYKSTISPGLGYSAGISLSYAPNKIIVSGGIDYSIIREKFNYTDSVDNSYTSNNHFSYIDLSLTGGYWMGRDNEKISVIVSGGVTYNLMVGQSGMIYDAKTLGVIDLSSSEKIKTSQYSLTASCKLVLRPQSRMKYSIEPYYMGSIATINQSDYPYLQYYNRVGIRFGVLFSI